jgi:hypothetical protein
VLKKTIIGDGRYRASIVCIQRDNIPSHIPTFGMMCPCKGENLVHSMPRSTRLCQVIRCIRRTIYKCMKGIRSSFSSRVLCH